MNMNPLKSTCEATCAVAMCLALALGAASATSAAEGPGAASESTSSSTSQSSPQAHAGQAQAESGQDTLAAQPESTASSPVTRPLTVAVLDFGADDAQSKNLGAQISAAINAMLAGEQGFKLVDRADLNKTLHELELNLTGLVDTAQAVRIGQLVGAQIIITGKAFPLGDKLFITAKLIGVETSLVDAVLVRGDPRALDDLVSKLAMKIADHIRKDGRKLVAPISAETDPLQVLKKQLATRRLPVVAVVIPESHLGRPAAPRLQGPDPAVATEIKKMLRTCGFSVIDTTHNELADWARQLKENDADSWPHALAKADVVIVGKAFSQYAGQIGHLISAAARAEINVIDHKTGHVLLADRATTRAVDLAQAIAGRKALQKAGHELGLRVLKHLAKTLPGKEKTISDDQGKHHPTQTKQEKE